MGAGAFAAIVIAVVATGNAAPEPTISSKIEEMKLVSHELAVACYNEGFQTGRLVAYSEQVKELGGILPKKGQDLIDQGATPGCRK